MEALKESCELCPYCGEPITLLIEFTQAGDSYVEDCSVCCQPMVVEVYATGDGELSAQLTQENA